MSDTSTDLQDLIDKFQSGGPAARRAFLERALDRVRRLAAKMLAESFPRLQSQHDLESIVNESWLRLSQSLEETNPPTVQDFFRLAAFKIRQVLIDMVRNQQRRQRQLHDSGTPFDDPSQDTYNPARLSAWTEFHERVPQLAEDEQSVFVMHYYLDIPQAEIAGLLSLAPRQVSRLWIKATRSLTAGLDLTQGVVS